MDSEYSVILWKSPTKHSYMKDDDFKEFERFGEITNKSKTLNGN